MSDSSPSRSFSLAAITMAAISVERCDKGQSTKLEEVERATIPMHERLVSDV